MEDTTGILGPPPAQPAQPAPAAGGSSVDLMIQAAAKQHNIDPRIFRALLMQESSLNPNAAGRAGELGIAQFTPATAQAFGIDPRNPQQAIPAAALYLRQNLNRFGNNYDQALAAYNWGPGNVQRQGMANAPTSVRSYVAKILGGGAGGSGAPMENAQGGSVSPPVSPAPAVSPPASPGAAAAPAPAAPGSNQQSQQNQQIGPGGLGMMMAQAWQQQLARNAGLA